MQIINSIQRESDKTLRKEYVLDTNSIMKLTLDFLQYENEDIQFTGEDEFMLVLSDFHYS